MITSSSPTTSQPTLITQALARTSSPPTTSRTSSTASWASSTASWLSSTALQPAPTASQPLSTATYISNSTPYLHQGASKPFPCSIDDQLHRLFLNHSKSNTNESGEPAIPANALIDILSSFSDVSTTQLLSEDELALKPFQVDNSGPEVTPQTLPQFIAEQIRASPLYSPDSSDNMQLLPMRGRSEEKDGCSCYCWSWSGESTRTSCYSPSETTASSHGPQTPNEGQGDGRDGYGRYWTSCCSSTGSRATSHGQQSSDDLSLPPIHSAPTSDGHPCSRPRSRAQSLSTNNFGHGKHGYSLPDDDHSLNGSSSDPGTFVDSMSSLLMPRENENEDDPHSDSEDSTLGLVTDHLTTSLTVSLEPLVRLDMLERANVDSNRTCMEARSLLSVPEIGKENPSSLLLAPSFPIIASSIPHQQQCGTQDEHLSIPSSRVVPVIEQFRTEEGFKKSPMAHLIEEYSSAMIQSQLGSTQRTITLVLNQEELTSDHVVDRGEDRARNLPRYHLVKAMMSILTVVVTAQQMFLQ